MSRYSPKRRSPYEVMQGGGLGTATAPHSAPGSSTGQGAGGRGEPSGESGHWVQRAGYPVVLRIPRGYALLLGVAAIGLVILAYQTGYTRGYRTGEHLTEVSYPALANPVAQPVILRQTAPGTIETTARSVPAAVGAVGGMSDTREVGLNYYVLAHYPRAEAEKLVRFLWGQGVGAAAYRPENKQFFQVLSLQGFGRNEVSGPGPNAFRERLQRLGRYWVKKYKGAEDFSQSGIYLAKYKGGTYAEIITRKTLHHEH